jgi:hypothetical protein
MPDAEGPAAAAEAFVALSYTDADHETALMALGVPALREACKALGLNTSGNKPDLQQRIRAKKQQPEPEVPVPTTQAGMLELNSDKLKKLCKQLGLSADGTDSVLQGLLNDALFDDVEDGEDRRTPDEKVRESCDAEVGAILLKVAPGGGRKHSAVGGWVANALNEFLGKTVTLRAIRRAKVTFRPEGSAHDQVVYADTVKHGDPGFVKFVETIAMKLEATVRLPAHPEPVGLEDAEDVIVDILGELQSPTAAPGAAAPVDFAAALQTLTQRPAAKVEPKFDNAALSAAAAILKDQSFYVDRYEVPRFTQVEIINLSVNAKVGGRTVPQLAVDPRVQPAALRALLDGRGNMAPDQAKMVQQSDGTYVEATTAEQTTKKTRTAMEVAHGYRMYWVAHLVAGSQMKDLDDRYDGRTSTSGLWLHPYHVSKFQGILWRLVPRITGDVLDSIMAPLLHHAQEQTNSGEADAWTGEQALEYMGTKLAEQVNLAAAFASKRKPDGQPPKDAKKPRPNAVPCTAKASAQCAKTTTHQSKICLPCKKHADAAAGAPAAAPAAAPQ